ncbi:MAG: hypothetical protein JEZ07_10545 [Phycisphaerae bacterium]|nr:hypothetical protein [Phycisphaerae bacterium]
MSIFEIGMMACFGAAWPVSIYKSIKSRCNDGKSLYFMIIVLLGYICGVIHKYFYNMDNVIWLYIFNSLLVFIDLGLYYRNHKRNQI